MAKSNFGYVDGYVLAVPRKNMTAYRKMAQRAGEIWRKHGALQYLECTGDDLMPKGGLAKFPAAVKAKKGETVIFSYIVFKSRAHRDAVNTKVMKDPAMGAPDDPIPFDMKRMIYGGFKVLVNA